MMWEYCRFCNLTGCCENQDRGHECNSGAKKLYEENQHLKKLLQEAKDILEWYKADCGYRDTPTETILTRIDNAIGEKK